MLQNLLTFVKKYNILITKFKTRKLEEKVLAIGDIIVGMDIGTSKVSVVIGEVINFNQIEIICNCTGKCSGIK